ncbi:MAG: hypothetical protein ACI9UN_004927 [Granulosicoccus sp.]|jgi:hypothetical protein
MLLAVDLDEDFIDVEGVTVTSMLSLQATCKNGSEFDTPETDCFAADSDSSFGEEVFNIAMAQVETIVEPDSVRNYVKRESVSFICIHPLIPLRTGIMAGVHRGDEQGHWQHAYARHSDCLWTDRIESGQPYDDSE